MDKPLNCSQQIFEMLFDMLKKGSLKPGDKLPTERAMSESMGVSRNSVREALKAMSCIGLVTARQGGGTYVNEYDSGYLNSLLKYLTVVEDNNMLLEILQIRKALESEAAKLAALNATAEDINNIERLLYERENTTNDEALDADSKREVLNTLDMDFHMAIAKASGNGAICEFISAISNIFGIHQNRAAEGFRSPGISNTFHRKIFNAIRSRNPELAREVAYEHIASVEDAIKQTWSEN
ncbi:MAG: FadR family transcriptional regulator [Spirochaetales bacterium]|nr:FadR family transcriptional regulator [Spirochaetales bacterium]